jgi:hypothetical protein
VNRRGAAVNFLTLRGRRRTHDLLSSWLPRNIATMRDQAF